MGDSSGKQFCVVCHLRACDKRLICVYSFRLRNGSRNVHTDTEKYMYVYLGCWGFVCLSFRIPIAHESSRRTSNAARPAEAVAAASCWLNAIQESMNSITIHCGGGDAIRPTVYAGMTEKRIGLPADRPTECSSGGSVFVLPLVELCGMNRRAAWRAAPHGVLARQTTQMCRRCLRLQIMTVACH